ncbi:MAG: hypothetical protein KKH98_09755, partial [Spirochaetes bacterium]|nr:hypothetical protein [Spirochaetota bacterium]
KKIQETDICIIDMKVTPENPAKGQDTEVKVFIQNQGTVKTPQTPIKLIIDKKLIKTLSFPELDPNEVIIREFIWKAE